MLDFFRFFLVLTAYSPRTNRSLVVPLSVCLFVYLY